MTAIRGSVAGFFCGMQVMDFNVSMDRGIHPYYMPGGEYKYSMVMPRSTIDLLCLATRNPGDLFDMFNGNAYTLGMGTVCPYCGDYNPAGLARCHRCGGETEWRAHVSVEKLPFMVSSVDVSAQADDYLVVNVALMSLGDVSLHDISAIVGYDFAAKEPLNTEFFWGRTDYYLCQYCGQAVPEGDICPSCRGTRTPWAEILKMDRECIYCGTKVFGGIVCPGCGRRLAGLTLAEQKRKGVISTTSH